MAKNKKSTGTGKQANAKTNAGNQTTVNHPQTNNVSNNNTNQPSNNTKGKSSTGNKPVNSKLSKLWRVGASTLPFVAEAALERLNSTSPTKSNILPYEPLWDTIKNQDDISGYTLEGIDAILSPSNSNIWKKAIDGYNDLTYSIWSNAANIFSDDEAFNHNVGALARDLASNAISPIPHMVDWGTYFTPLFPFKLTRDVSKSTINNILDVPRDIESIKEYSYKNLGYNDYIGDSFLRGAEAGINNLFSRFGKNRDFYQRGRYSLNEMLNTIAKDIKNFKDKNSPEYKDLIDKFERFNNLAKSSDFYWNTKKEMDASDLSKEDFLKAKNLTPEAFDAFEQNAYALHNLGSNLALNESNGTKRSEYTPGNHNYSYIDYTDAVNEAKKGLSGDITGDISDTTKNTLNDAKDTGVNAGKPITGKPVDNATIGTGTNTDTTNTINENSQSSLTPDYLTEFYKKFDKKYGYDPAKGRFNIWL